MSTRMRKSRLSLEPSVLLVYGEVDPNEQHPLFDVDSDRRSQQRQSVIGAILARLAQESDSGQKSVATIRQRSRSAN